jgi:hypothetical protein
MQSRRTGALRGEEHVARSGTSRETSGGAPKLDRYILGALRFRDWKLPEFRDSRNCADFYLPSKNRSWASASLGRSQRSVTRPSLSKPKT